MSEIILKTTAIKIINRGGGTMVRRDPLSAPDDQGRVMAIQKTDTGSDYVVFNCPHPKCGKRNKQCMYSMANYKPANEDVIPFYCNVCRRLVEVSRPPADLRTARLIIAPSEFNMAQRR